MQEQKRPLPTSIGPSWRVLKPLGRGAMGSVFLCEDRLLPGRLAAVKLLRHKVGDRERMSRFGRELEALERLSHPGIVSARGAGVDGSTGRLYLAMEYVEGPSLAKRLRDGPLDAEEATKVFGVLFDAIFHAHVRGVHHRDVKPANIVIGVDGPRLVDFGIAMFGSEREQAELLGTPVYMAPEVLEGPDYDPASVDLHALGIVMYEALTGERPFEYDVEVEPEEAAGRLIEAKRARADLDPGEDVPDPLRTLVRGVTSSDATVRLNDRVSIMRLLSDARSLMLESCPDLDLDNPAMAAPDSFEVADRQEQIGLMPLLADEYARARELNRGQNREDEGDEDSASISSFFAMRETAPVIQARREEEEVSAVVAVGVAVLLTMGLLGAIFAGDDRGPSVNVAHAMPVETVAAVDVEPPWEFDEKPQSLVYYEPPLSPLDPVDEDAVALIEPADLEEDGDEETPRARVRSAPSKQVEDVELEEVLGKVYLSSEPSGASIRVDGTPLGRTPAEISLPLGSYAFVLRKPGFEDVEQTLKVDASENVVAMVLSPSATVGSDGATLATTGPVALSMAGWKGATLLVDGVEVGTLPIQLDLAAGWHEFRVQGEVGEIVQRREVKLPPKGVAKLRLRR